MVTSITRTHVEELVESDIVVGRIGFPGFGGGHSVVGDKVGPTFHCWEMTVLTTSPRYDLLDNTLRFESEFFRH